MLVGVAETVDEVDEVEAKEAIGGVDSMKLRYQVARRHAHLTDNKYNTTGETQIQIQGS